MNNLYTLLDRDIIVAGDDGLSMVSTWDGQGTIKVFQVFSDRKMIEVDTIFDQNIDTLEDAIEYSMVYFENMHREYSELAVN